MNEICESEENLEVWDLGCALLKGRCKVVEVLVRLVKIDVLEAERSKMVIIIYKRLYHYFVVGVSSKYYLVMFRQCTFGGNIVPLP